MKSICVRAVDVASCRFGEKGLSSLSILLRLFLEQSRSSASELHSDFLNTECFGCSVPGRVELGDSRRSWIVEIDILFILKILKVEASSRKRWAVKL